MSDAEARAKAEEFWRSRGILPTLDDVVSLAALLRAAGAGTWSKDRPRVVCLCGSTRFAETFNEDAARLTLAGEIVVRPEVVTYSRENDPQHIAPEVKAGLDELHLRKIDLADYVRVLNVGGYVGESTRREIAYAERTWKPVEYLEPR
ncbi:MAG TPA: hypothetical protein VFX78_11385 [Candidatus Eisenbacteria bacterium]|nr:hypothetical protein [Candidatus Eisenbacteria bacterium]